MKRMFAVGVVGLLTVASLLAPCCPAGAQTQGEMNQQAGAEYQKADRELNMVYRKLLARLSPKEKVKLVRAQRAWTAFRDAEMAFAGEGYQGGSMRPMVESNAAAHLTTSRTRDLKQYLSDYNSR